MADSFEARAREAAKHYALGRIVELQQAIEDLHASGKAISHLWIVNEQIDRTIRKAQNDDPQLADDWKYDD